MSTNKHDTKTWTVADFARYHDGSMPSAERHALEKAALEDPFLDDALEGYAFASDPVADIAALTQKLQPKKEEAKIIWFKQRPVQQFLRVAAILILFGGLAWVLFPAKKETNPAQIAAVTPAAADSNESKLAPAGQETVAPVIREEIIKESTGTAAADKPLPKTEQAAPKVQDNIAPVMAEHSADDESFARMEKMSSEKRMKAADEQRKDVAVTLSGKVAGVETKLARAAQNQVQGTVVDAAGNAVPYATVQVGATNAVTTADENGNFQLNQPSTAESVRVNVTAAGYETKNLALSNNVQNNQVVLNENKGLSEVVVTGYGTEKKKMPVAVPAQTVASFGNMRLQLVNASLLNSSPAVQEDLNKLIAQYIKADTSGKVVIRFNLDKKGKAIDLQVQNSLCNTCDAEVINLIQQLPALKKIRQNQEATAIFQF